MQNLSLETNALNWFEIPVIDTKRAKKFYETILDIELKTQYSEETNDEMIFFPSSPQAIQATSGRVTGVLLRNKHTKPSMYETIVYFNANPSIQKVIDRIERAGGKLIQPKTKIKEGYFSIFMDTEGNKMALHSNY